MTDPEAKPVRSGYPTKNNSALLPPGMMDMLPPQAHRIFSIQEQLLRTMRTWGYRHVRPPLLEFEDSSFAAHGQAWRDHAFRCLDPVSQQLMAIRCDMTTQIIRLASDRFGHLPRPLRLCYAGAVLKTQQEQSLSLRERRQVGAELFAPDDLAADDECLNLALDCLNVLAVRSIHVSLSYPSILRSWLDQHDLTADLCQEALEALAWQHTSMLIQLKDRLTSSQMPAIDGLLEWINVAHTHTQSEKRLRAYHNTVIGSANQPALNHLGSLLKMRSDQNVTWHLDLADIQGFSYQSGFCFAFVTKQNGLLELGRGGRYIWQDQSAIGFSFYLDALEGCSRIAKPPLRVYLPWSERSNAPALRADGYSVVADLAPLSNKGSVVARALELDCQAIWQKKTGLHLINDKHRETR